MIIADLLKLGRFANAHENIDFPVAARVLRNYGFEARKAG
jgi:hypothetical protein